MVAATQSVDRSSIVQRLKSEAAELYQHVEQILFVELENHQQVDAEQWVLLRSAGITTPRELEKQLGRAQAVKRAMAIAGSPAEYEKSKETLAAAQATADKELPEIREQIQTLEARAIAIEEALTAAEMDFEERTEHRRVLRERQLLPPWVAADRDNEISRLNRGFEELGGLRVRVETAQRAMELPSDDPNLGVIVKALVGEQFIQEGWATAIDPKLHGAALAAVEETHETDLKALEAMEAEYNAELAAVEAEFSDFYVNQL